MACLPKVEGGLGVLDLQTQNECLLLKNLHKFFNRLNIPWVQLIWSCHYNANRLPQASGPVRGSFWCRDVLKLLSKFKSFAVLLVRDGATCFLWHDPWNSTIWSQQFPELYSFCRDRSISLKAAIAQPLPKDLFHVPLTTEAYTQFQQLVQSFQNLQLQHTPDRWSYTWGSTYSSSRAYRYLIGHRQVHHCYSWFWRSACQHKRKVFFWLLLKDRISTRQLLRRRSMYLDDYNCFFFASLRLRRICSTYSFIVPLRSLAGPVYSSRYPTLLRSKSF